MILLDEHTSLLQHNTLGLAAKARYFAEFHSIDELRELIERFRGQRKLVIGAGSNLLFTKDFDGLVLHSSLNYARALDEDATTVDIEVGSGIVLDDLIAQVVDMGLWGLENLSYIPGEVGASAVQNVGAYGVEACDVIRRVNMMDIESGEERTVDVDECQYGYRDSIFKRQWAGRYVVTSVVYHLSKTPQPKLDYGGLRASLGTQPTLDEIRQAVIRIRQSKLPEVSELGSAGSFFKNPVIPIALFLQLKNQYPDMPSYEMNEGRKIPAAWLIDQCGWRGKRVGGAQVYEKQPLVLVNADQATSQDIISLAEQIALSVKQKFGIGITPEVNYI